MTATGRLRICVGATHAEGCHHEQYMAQGVTRFLAHPRTRRALTLALSQAGPAPMDPYAWAERILVEMERGYAHLDAIECETDEPAIESRTHGGDTYRATAQRDSVTF